MIKPEPGIYNEPIIIELSKDVVEYSFDGEKFFSYYGPFLLENTTTLYVKKNHHEILTFHYEINDSTANCPGKIFIIGGADKSFSIHQAIVEASGEKENTRIAFIPAGSANPYAAGMDRWVRFEKYCGLRLNYDKIPVLNGKFDFSSLDNNECFWIVPVALIDDPYTNARPTNDPDHVINDESTYPDINESLWKTGSINPGIASKLLKGNYHVIFLTGGNQARYVALFFYPDGRETLLLQVIKYLHKKGTIIAGTSAGAASLSKLMLMSGGSAFSWLEAPYIEKLKDEINDPESFPIVKNGLIIGKGLGILPDNMIVDTHFSQRGRQGRLLRAVEYLAGNNTEMWGIGVDEDTAAILSADELRVVGSGTVLLAKKETNFSFLIHCLSHGDKVKRSVHKYFVVQSLVFEGIEVESNDLPDYIVEPDIFGKDKFNKLIQNQLVSSNLHLSYGLIINDRDENSSDVYPSLNSYEALPAMIFHKRSDSKWYRKEVEIKNFGFKDKHYPNIQLSSFTQISYSNIVASIKMVDLVNVPYFLHIAPSITDNFNENKETKIGILAHRTNINWIVHFSFYDYAYDDETRSLILLTEPCAKGTLTINNKIFQCDENGFCLVSFDDMATGVWNFQTKKGRQVTFKIDKLSDFLLLFSNETF
ncbi:MAG: cyanophycinase [Bacteroidales bacterium]|nr:cyanophycinase [Bacteroidales bacterium]